MCLVDIGTGFRSIRRSMEQLIGPVSKTVLYNAGFQSAAVFARRAVEDGRCAPGRDAFAFSVESYAEAGFGGFEVREVDLARQRATVACHDPPAFEADPFLQGDRRAEGPVCDYSRGVLAGFLMAVTDQDDIFGCEVQCRAVGDEACTYLVGPEQELVEHELGRRMGFLRARDEGR